MVIENLLNAAPGTPAGFYRTAGGAEIDLVLHKGNRKIAIECKASAVLRPGRGFYQGMEDLGIEEAWIIAPVDMKYPLKKNVYIMPLSEALKEILEW